MDVLRQKSYQFTLSQQAAGDAFNFDKAVRGFRQVTGLGIVWAIQMERIAVGYSILESAQERYNRTVEKYGAASYQAVEAGKQLERIENYVYRAKLRSYATTIGLTSSMILQTGVLNAQNRAMIVSTAQQVYHTAVDAVRTSGIWAQVQAMIALHSLTPVGWGILAAGAGVAAGALGTYTAMGGFGGGVTVQGSEINVYGTSEEELRTKLRERENEICEDYARIKGGG